MFERDATATHFAESCRQYHRSTHTMFAAGFNDVGHSLGLGADHRQLDWRSDCFYRGIGTLALHFLMYRMYRIE